MILEKYKDLLFRLRIAKILITYSSKSKYSDNEIAKHMGVTLLRFYLLKFGIYPITECEWFVFCDFLHISYDSCKSNSPFHKWSY